MDSGGQSVSYTTKELIAEINRKLDRVLLAVENKADKSTTDSLLSFAQGNEKRIAQLEYTRNQYVPIVDESTKKIEGLEMWRNRLIALYALLFPLATVSFGVIIDHFLIK